MVSGFPGVRTSVYRPRREVDVVERELCQNGRWLEGKYSCECMCNMVREGSASW